MIKLILTVVWLSINRERYQPPSLVSVKLSSSIPPGIALINTNGLKEAIRAENQALAIGLKNSVAYTDRG